MSDEEKSSATENAAESSAAASEKSSEEIKQEAEQVVYDVQDILRGKGIFAEEVAGRDIFQAYIQRGDRTTIFNIYGEAGRRPVSPTDAAVPRRAHRIGDLSLNPLPQSEIDRTSATYEPLRNHKQALQRLREHHLIILHGEPGIGKRTAAIRLLTEYFQGNLVDNTIYELNPNLKLAQLNVDDIPDHAGLFLESSDGSAWQNFNHFHLNALLTRLQDPNKNNALILILEQAPTELTASHQHLLQPWLLQWPEPIPETQTKVLLKHFTYAAHTHAEVDPTRQPEFEALVQQEQVQALLQQPQRPVQLAQLAQLLLQVLLTDLSLEDALARFGDRAEEEVAAWFEMGHEPELETLLIATAVFNGLSYTFIREAAQKLLDILLPKEEASPPEKQPAPGRRTSLFAARDSVAQRLKAIHAHQERAPRRSHFGDVQEKVVKLDNEQWQPAVLHYLWQLDGFQEPLLNWLTPYGDASNYAIRTRAAAAIGALALEEFGFIEARVLRGWAASPYPDTRRSAALVLGMTIWDERHSGVSAGLLHYWATQKDNWRWQWTAAAAYAGLAGSRFPQQTLNDLRAIARETVSRPMLLQPYLQAMLNAYASGQSAPEQRLAVLQALHVWSEMPEVRAKRKETFALRRTALLSFLYLLMPDEHDPVWRLLLEDIGVSETYRQLACALLHRALNFRQPDGWTHDSLHPRKMALDLIQQLITFVGKENHPEHYAHLRDFLIAYRQSIADSPHDIQRIQHKALHWEEAQKAAPELINLLLSSS